MSQSTTNTTGNASSEMGQAPLPAPWAQWDSPPEQFLQGLLLYQCRIGGADAGAILRQSGDTRVDVIAAHPSLERGATAPVWLAQAVEVFGRVAGGNTTAMVPVRPPGQFYGVPSSQYLLLLPLRAIGGARGVGAYLILSSDQNVLAHSRERLELTANLMALHDLRLALLQRQQDVGRLRRAMEMLAAVQDHDRLLASGLELCNEAAARFSLERHSLGLLTGRYIRLVAMSHTEKVSRRARLVQDLENAMEECLDQDVEVAHPAPPEATFVHRAAGLLAQQHGPVTVVSLPLRRQGKAVGALTVERAPDRPLTGEEVEALRLVCDLVTPRLLELRQRDRFIGAKAADAARSGLAAIVGPRHTWAKVLALGVIAAILALTLIHGRDRVEAPFTIETSESRQVPAPFEAPLASVEPGVEPGLPVHAGQLLARLDTGALLDQLASAQAEFHRHQLEADTALKEGKTPDQHVAEAQRDQAAAQVSLLEHQLAQAEIRAPIDGVVLKGDLKREIGAKKKLGDLLFEIGPLTRLRAVLKVPEDRIADVGAARQLSGELAAASNPARRLSFTVERVNPVAEVVSGRNVFSVVVRFTDDPASQSGANGWLRPGVEGVAKIDVGDKAYLQLWTRDLVQWVRMKLWW